MKKISQYKKNKKTHHILSIVALCLVIFNAGLLIGNSIMPVFTSDIFNFSPLANAASSINQLQNPSFENSLSPWMLNVNTQSASATATQDTTTAVDGTSSAKIAITQNSPVFYDVQFRQSGLVINKGDLVTLSFWAKADTNRSIVVDIQKSSTPYTVYSEQTVNLTTNWQVYSIVYQATSTDTNAWIAFNTATTTGTVWIDKTTFIHSPTSAKIYSGAYLGGWIMQPPDFEPFESDAQKKLSIVMQYQAWALTDGTQNFQKTWMDSVRSHGSIPLITWEPWDYTKGVNQPTYALSNIINGKFDTYIKKWALDSKAWGKPYFLRFAHEMNGNWYPWSEQVNGNHAGDYVKAWKHIHDIFVRNGATNVTWIWSPNIIYTGSIPMNQVYPGNSYVDWVGLDGYNWGTTNGGWQTFETIFTPSYNQITSLTTKPLMVNETASAEQGGNKADWINNAYIQKIPYAFPKVKAVVWFNINKENDWRIESSTASQQSFADAIKSFIYQTNTYSTISKTPIPTP